MLKHLRTLFCLTILLCLIVQISFAKSGFTLIGGYNMSKTKFKDDNNLVLVNTSASLANLKAQIAPQKIINNLIISHSWSFLFILFS